MDLEIEDLGDVVVLTPAEHKIDASNAYMFKEMALRNLRDDRSVYLLDLSAVVFMDSSGIGAVVGVLKGLRPGETLQICGLNPAVDRVFGLLHLKRLFSIHETRDIAFSQYEPAETRADAPYRSSVAPEWTRRVT